MQNRILNHHTILIVILLAMLSIFQQVYASPPFFNQYRKDFENEFVKYVNTFTQDQLKKTLAK